MSRVERTETPSQRHGSEPRRQTQRGLETGRTAAPGRTPGKAEGEERDVEEALKHQTE